MYIHATIHTPPSGFPVISTTTTQYSRTQKSGPLNHQVPRALTQQYTNVTCPDSRNIGTDSPRAGTQFSIAHGISAIMQIITNNIKCIITDEYSTMDVPIFLGFGEFCDVLICFRKGEVCLQEDLPTPMLRGNPYL